MSILGVTGVEDLLQDDIKNVIATIRNAGIKVWMLTGDKLETAKCIAISTGFKSTTQRFFELTANTPAEIIERLDRFDPDFTLLVVPGDVLETILGHEGLRKLFISKALKAKSVVLCRCAPKQKAEIATLLKVECKRTVCGIGDGGNDVGMIQSASIGIGIEGKEGLQASLASDFSIRQFKHLVPLCLWHGRLSYVRTAVLANLVIHRGFIVTTIQYLFMVAFHFITLNMYNGYLNMFYGTVFTNFLVFSLVLDVDVPRHQVLNYPQLYRLIGSELSVKVFCFWVFKAIFQGSIILFLALLLFEDPFLLITTITFTALVLTEYLTILLIVRTWHRLILLGLFVSLIAYLVCLLILPDVFLLSRITWEDVAKIFVLVIAGWLPFAIYYIMKRSCCPGTVDKIIMEAKMMEQRKLLDGRRSNRPTSFQSDKLWM
jgi:phospholipid-translocating ATPase